jgi:SAM-dependent MidA family methyltransferase
MHECLLHPEYGYYKTRMPFGGAGDFVTAPEISQMFGELLGLALAQSWLDQGAPARFALAEFGPGRGTLMADILRAARGVPGFHAAAKIVLLEASAMLREVQGKALAGYQPQWIDQPEDLPDLPLFLVANEFFDALGVHQFQRSIQGWQERMITAQDGQLGFVLGPALPPDLFDLRFAADPSGTLVELRPAADGPMRAASARIRAFGGLALIADYGGWRSKGDTLQAVRAHGFADPLQDPGMADLTAHVDFEALVQGSGLAHSYAPQGRVLAALGIEARTQALAQKLSGAALDNHLAAARRLTAPKEMGEVFKILALYPKTAPKPPGFADA